MASQSDEYLRSAVETATPEQLQLMLYDGAIKFARRGREALARRDFEASCESLIRAQRIVLEMRNGLRHEVNPELCDQLSGLYGFVHSRLIDANTKHDPVAIDEALQILDHQRETWRILLEKIRTGGPAASPNSDNQGQPALCLQG